MTPYWAKQKALTSNTFVFSVRRQIVSHVSSDMGPDTESNDMEPIKSDFFV